jgi:hypothetical protein
LPVTLHKYPTVDFDLPFMAAEILLIEICSALAARVYWGTLPVTLLLKNIWRQVYRVAGVK